MCWQPTADNRTWQRAVAAPSGMDPPGEGDADKHVLQQARRLFAGVRQVQLPAALRIVRPCQQKHQDHDNPQGEPAGGTAPAELGVGSKTGSAKGKWTAAPGCIRTKAVSSTSRACRCSDPTGLTMLEPPSHAQSPSARLECMCLLGALRSRPWQRPADTADNTDRCSRIQKIKTAFVPT